MAEEVDETIDDDDDSNWEYEDDAWGEEPQMFNDDSLRGFRFFWGSLNQEEHDENDETVEQTFEESLIPSGEVDSAIMPPQLIAEKLSEKGFTFDRLVLALLAEHDGYQETERTNGEVYGAIRRIVLNHSRVQGRQVQAVAPVPVAIQAVDFEAQPKSTLVRNVSRITPHIL
jgi:hypothetical protein